jgi:hypothetical protein
MKGSDFFGGELEGRASKALFNPYLQNNHGTLLSRSLRERIWLNAQNDISLGLKAP